jgi:hypothetical protein
MNRIGFSCILFVMWMIFAWSLYPPNTSFSLPSFSSFVTYDDGETGNVDESIYKYNNFTDFSELPLDLRAATYRSDGTNLNVTLWLEGQISSENHQDYVDQQVGFDVDIYQIDPDDLSEDYIMYSIIVSPEPDGTWNKTIFEWSPPYPDEPQDFSEFKVLRVYHNYSGFFENNKNYINIPISLSDIANPPSFGIGFNIHTRDYALEDYTFVTSAPPRQNRVIFQPSLLEARAGEITRFDISVHTVELEVKQNISLYDANETDDISLSFEPNIVDLELNGTKKTKLVLDLPRDKQVGEIIAVEASVRYTTVEGISSNDSETFNIEVLPPLSDVDKAMVFLNGYYGFYWIPLGITGVFALWLARRMDEGAISSLQIGHRDILAINASVIAGVLIFLTIGGSTFYGGSTLPPADTLTPEDSNRQNLTNIGILTASIVWPFAISAIVTLLTGKAESGVKWTIPGFVYLMVSVILISFGIRL